MSKVIDEVVLKKAITEVLQVVADNTFDFVEYESDEINALFDVESPEKLAYYESLINPDLISENRLWASKTIADKIAESILQANEYSDDLIKNISSIQLEWCETSLPVTGETNKIYILPVASGSDTVNTLNIWNATTSAYVTIGNLEIDLSQYYTSSQIDTKLADKANSSEVLAVNKVQTTTGSETNDTVYCSKLTKDELDKKVNVTDIVDNLTSTDTDKPLSANQGKVLKGEVDLKANDDEVIKKTDITTTIDSSSTDTQVPSAKTIREYSLGLKYNYEFQNSDSLNVMLPYPGFYKINAPTIGVPEGNPQDYVLLNIPWVETNRESKLLFGEQFLFSPRVNYYWRRTVWNYQVDNYNPDSDNGTFNPWQRVCATTVADVPETEINTNNTNLTKTGECCYLVENGICYVSLWGIKSSALNKQIVSADLPNPKIKVGSSMSYDDTTSNMGNYGGYMYINKGGTLCIDIQKTNFSLFGAFSYPVAES